MWGGGLGECPSAQPLSSENKTKDNVPKESLGEEELLRTRFSLESGNSSQSSDRGPQDESPIVVTDMLL